jgi:hypothetical protein
MYKGRSCIKSKTYGKVLSLTGLTLKKHKIL